MNIPSLRIKKILFITLSNIGDVILTLPALDYLINKFPETKISVLVGPRPKEIFENNPIVDKLFIYDKGTSWQEKLRLWRELKREKFDLVVDLRNSLLGFLLPAPYKTSAFLIFPQPIRHMRDKHLYRIQNPCLSGRQAKFKIQEENLVKAKNSSLFIQAQDQGYIEEILRQNKISEKNKIVVISAGARSHIKRWTREGFRELISALIQESGVKVILVGDKQDMALNQYLTAHFKGLLLDLSGKTSIGQLACLFQKSMLVITNDSANLHLASYLNRPVVAIFGPTDEVKYGPWSDKSEVVKKDIACRPCQRAQCRFATLKCMELIKSEEVMRAIRKIMAGEGQSYTISDQRDKFKRILIVRTDRIGDVLLSTPVIRVLRGHYPSAYIAMMVSPYTQEILEGNPYLDEVIIYDKDRRHKSWLSSLKFALGLKQKNFDLCLILHPTNRVHILTFLAGIPRRIGYDRKLGFLLSDRIKHTKQLGQKHELEYTLDLVRHLGIQPKDKSPFMPIKPESERWVEGLFRKEGIRPQDKILAVHPGASCKSKLWPAENFARLGDLLIEKNGFKVFIVAAAKDLKLAERVIKNMRHPAINLAGQTSLSQLASLFKRCCLFISNDSGPVHIAAGVGIKVISIFGRNQKGLSPARWGPIGTNCRVLHKDIGCDPCLAHNCIKGFACLQAISVEDVLGALSSL